MPNAYYLFHTLPWRVSADDPTAATPAPTSGQGASEEQSKCDPGQAVTDSNRGRLLNRQCAGR